MGTQGGIFQLITRDARNDQYLQGGELLRSRLCEIKKKRSKERARLRASGDPAWAAYPIEPTFADVECSHILPVRRSYRPFCAVGSQYHKIPSSGGGSSQLTSSDGSLVFALPTFGDFLSDMVLHVRLDAVGDTSGATHYEYTHYPGIRLVKEAQLKSDQVAIDSYTRDDALFVDKFWVDPKDRDGWDRCHGEQVAQTGEYWNSNEFTGCETFKDGPQTRRLLQPALELWIPLQFSTGQDASQSIPNDMLSNSQRAVEITLASLGEMIRARNATGDIIDLPIGSVGFRAELYANQLYVNPEIHDIFSARLGFTLIRVHQTQRKTVDAPSGSVRLDRIKYPVEFLQVGVRDVAAAADFDRWHLFGRRRVRAAANALLAPAAIYNIGLGICQLVCRELTETTTLDALADTLHVSAAGVELYTSSDSRFYQAYLPLRWRKRTPAVTPKDRGVLLVPFDLYPGSDQPSGYLNLSTEREAILGYTAPEVSPAAPAEFVVAASALNFMVRDGDSMRLRYST